MKNLINSLDFFIRWRVEDNDHRANEADGTSKLAQDTKSFIEEIRAENSANEDTESA